MYECSNCGGNLKFDIPSQQLLCAFCGTREKPHEVEKETDAVESEYFEATIFTCPQCAGELLSADNEATSFCSFCGASTILSSRISRERRPEYIIPFKKTKEDCKEAYAKKMRYAFFAPKELRDARHIDGFRGIYMPYWSYQLTQNKRAVLKGKKSHRRGDYIITDYYNLSGDLDAYYLGYSRDASSSFYDNISEALAPYDVKDLVKFTPSYLSGFYADTADVDENVYLKEVEELANNSSFEKMVKRPEFSGYHVKETTKLTGLGTRMGTKCREADRTMYPVWFLSYRNKDRVAYATVNGQTGKVVADMPIDLKRYIFCSLLLAVVIFLLLNLFLTLKPVTLLGLSSVLVLISALLYNKELKDIFRKENNQDDKGIKAAKEATGENGKKEKESLTLGEWLKKYRVVSLCIVMSLAPMLIGTAVVFLWPMIVVGMIIIGVIGIRSSQKLDGKNNYAGFIISIIVTAVALIIRVLDPVSDLYYYAGAFCALIAVLYNLFDLIRNYNRLAMRRLPQFDKKGGDDLA